MTEFREQILGDYEPDEVERPAALPKIEAPRLAGQPLFPDPGIYFGMPEEDYHAIHAVSASGMKRLGVSSMDYWATSCLNPDYAPRQSDYLDYGKAVHAFVLEGEEAYLSRYVVGLEQSDFEGVLISTDEIKSAIGKHTSMQPVAPKASTKQALIDELAALCQKHGRTLSLDGTVPELKAAIREFEEEQPVAPVSKVKDGEEMRSATKEDWIDQLLELDPDAKVWDRIVADHLAKHPGREVISAKDDRRIRIAARMISGHEEISKAFTGGYAEVSIFWYCPAAGVPCKARLDYLKMRAIVDLKTFSNATGKPIDRAIESAIANYRYNISHAHYTEAVQQAKAMVRESGHLVVKSMDEYDRDKHMERVKFCERLCAVYDEPGFIFVFQQSGIAPVTRGKVMPNGTVLSVTRSRIEEMKLLWRECALNYGTDPWLDISPIDVIEDEAIPLYATDIGRNSA